MGQRASNIGRENMNIQELNPLNQDENRERNENDITVSQNTENNIDFESIVDGGEIIYAPPKVIQSKIIKCQLNIHPKSLHFEQNQNLYRLCFTFDCEKDSIIYIFYSAKDVSEKDEQFSFKPLKEGKFNSIIKVKKGYNIQIQQDWEEAINFSSFKQEELKYDIVGKRYPLVIMAKADDEFGDNLLFDDQNKSENISNIQISYFNISRKEEEITAHLLQQKIFYNNHSYIVQEIYGAESSQGGECVVCMSEPRNVVVLPCRHMCLCTLCADIYRIKTNKCPICRGPSRSFIKVNDMKAEEEEEEKETSTPTSSTIKNPNSTYFEDDI